MAKILLTKGKYAIVDEKDYDFLSRFNWCVNNGYATTRVPRGGGKQMSMHRLILNAGSEDFVDHVNLNRFDNRRANIRICTRTQNARNKSAQKNSLSKIKGVSWDKNRNKWRVQLKADKTTLTKRFDSIKDAGQYYRLIAGIYHGDFARVSNK